MKCPNCGNEVNDDDKYCMKCGNEMPRNSFNSKMPDIDTEKFKEFTDHTFDQAKTLVMGTGSNGVNYAIRRYFLGFGDLIWISFVLALICTLFGAIFGATYQAMSYYGSASATLSLLYGIFSILKVIFWIAFAGFVALQIYSMISHMGKDQVDAATNAAIATLIARGQEKFNVDADQIQEIEPIQFAGAGNSPTALKPGVAPKRKLFRSILSLFSRDPIEAYRIGNDGAPRYLLVQATFYAFTDSQIMVYTGNMDISTGIIYDERVAQVFYKDVNGISQRDLLKKFRYQIIRKTYYTLKILELDVCGITYLSSFDSRFAGNAQESLAGMESYIREKKF